MSRTKLPATLIFLFMMLSAKAQPGERFQLPDSWAKDFVISLFYKGSMSGSNTEIRFTYDSCTYRSGSNSKKTKVYTCRMKEADRAAILKKLAELKVAQIKSESGMHVVYDGWSQSICIGTHCIDGGTSAEMSEQDKNVFLDAYRFLEDFAIKKSH